MAKVKRRFITVASREPVWEFGGPYAPFTQPFKCDVKAILNIIKNEKLEVYGVTSTGDKIKLDESNFDDSDAPADKDDEPPRNGGGSSGSGFPASTTSFESS